MLNAVLGLHVKMLKEHPGDQQKVGTYSGLVQSAMNHPLLPQSLATVVPQQLGTVVLISMA